MIVDQSSYSGIPLPHRVDPSMAESAATNRAFYEKRAEFMKEHHYHHSEVSILDDEYRSSITPPHGRVDRLFRVNWLVNTVYTNSGGPSLSVNFVAHQGKAVHMIDIREDEEQLTGSLGHIPGVDWFPLRLVLEKLLGPGSPLHKDDPIVFISQDGEKSSRIALLFHKEGYRYCAWMTGGMVGWKNLGFVASRDPAILSKEGQLSKRHPIPNHFRHEEGVKDPAVMFLGPRDIQKHIGDETQIRYMKVSALMLHGRISCVDGRDDSGVIGTPGGDAGEFILLLAATEKLLSMQFTKEQIYTLLTRRLETFGRFYYHTDSLSLDTLTAHMRTEPVLAECMKELKNPYQFMRFFQTPPKEARKMLLEILVEPNNLGCGHLKLTATKSEEYHVRNGLVMEVLRSMWTLLWEGHTEIDVVVLGGEHNESGVINVLMEDDIASFSQIPLISPSFGKKQSFINHPQLSSFLRRELARFMIRQKDVFKTAMDHPIKHLHEQMDALASVHLTHTLSALAAGKPIYELNFHDEDMVRVCGQDICIHY